MGSRAALSNPVVSRCPAKRHGAADCGRYGDSPGDGAVLPGLSKRRFHNRDADDFLGSHDMEDIITLIDGRPEIVEEVRKAPDDLRAFLPQEFGAFLKSRSFLDALPGHLLPDSASQQRIPILMERIAAIANL